MDDERSTRGGGAAEGERRGDPPTEKGKDRPGPGPLGIPQLLTLRYDTLGLGDRAAALLQAREAGKAAALEAASPEELESGPAGAYYRHVVRPSLESGRVDEETAVAWKQALEEGKALHDPRVQAFLFGWHERGVEILADLAAGGGDEPERAKWFLKGMKP